jgi:arylsulfatase
MKMMGMGAVSMAIGNSIPGNSDAAAGAAPQSRRTDAPPEPYNILFIVTDQERYFRPGELPQGFRRPAQERLAAKGIVFENHRINSAVCTPSRSVLYAGQHIQKTRMFDNTNFPWISSMSTEIRTLGHLLQEAGYYAAYKGKWHLTKEFETVNELGSPTKIFTKEMEAYGFKDYVGVGDIIAHTQGGYLHDGITASMSVSWLRGRGMELVARRKPWFLAVNFVNPHDIMFLNTDRPGEVVQARNILSQIEREPTGPLYAKQWEFDLPDSYRQQLDAPGRPKAHADYLRSHDALVGNIAEDEWRWRKRHNYYLNCIRDADSNMLILLDELEALGLASNTIIIMTSDHGDLDGAHRLHAKGATSFREQNNVPLIIVHPAYQGGKRCKAVTSHLDIAPTLVGLTNAGSEQKAAIAKRLPGKDFSSLLAGPEKAGHAEVRDGSLYCYNMFAYIDGNFALKAAGMLLQPDGRAKFQKAIREGALRPDLTKRGAIRSVFDGRYQLTRYFSPKQHNRPTSLEALFRLNDVELFDLQTDPNELENLAINPKKHGDLLEAMNAKLNARLDAEVGEDVGQMLPGEVDGGWVATDARQDL